MDKQFKEPVTQDKAAENMLLLRRFAANHLEDSDDAVAEIDELLAPLLLERAVSEGIKTRIRNVLVIEDEPRKLSPMQRAREQWGM